MLKILRRKLLSGGKGFKDFFGKPTFYFLCSRSVFHRILRGDFESFWNLLLVHLLFRLFSGILYRKFLTIFIWQILVIENQRRILEPFPKDNIFAHFFVLSIICSF